MKTHDNTCDYNTGGDDFTPKVLLVEDNAINQLVFRLNLEQHLKGFKYTLDIAGTGEEAISMFKQNNYNLVVLDLGLPDVLGLEVGKLLKSLNGNVPIVVWSANARNRKDECISAGFDDVIDKPPLDFLKDLIEPIKQYLFK